MVDSEVEMESFRQSLNNQKLPAKTFSFCHDSLSQPTMKFGYTIVYVRDVTAALSFFENAFGLTRRFVHESGYGELSTGETTLAFATHEMGAKNLPRGYVAADSSPLPLGIEIALVTEDVGAAHAKAISHGAKGITPPVEKPWGQTVSYVQSPDGILIELCTPVAA